MSLPATVKAGETVVFSIRQSHLRWLEEQCPAGAYAQAVEGRESPRTSAADRGQAIHEVYARYATHLWRTERQTDFEAVSRIAREVLQDYSMLTLDQRRDVLEQAESIGDGFMLEREHYYGSEEYLFTYVTLPDGRRARITGTLDLLEVDHSEGRARITDPKSNHNLYPDSRVREDFQLMLYALLVVDNVLGVEAVEGRLWFTRYNRYLPQKGEAVWTRAELEELRAHLAVRIQGLLDGKLRSDYAPGTHCQYCPRRRPGDCPAWRRYRGTSPPPLRTFYQARRAAARVIAIEQERDGLLTALKDYVNDQGPVKVGDVKRAEVFGFHESVSEDVDAVELLEVLEEPEVVSLIGTPDLSDLLQVNKRGKTWRSLKKIPGVGERLQDIIREKASTRFTHKGVE